MYLEQAKNRQRDLLRIGDLEQLEWIATALISRLIS